jgi:hypothetical protein
MPYPMKCVVEDFGYLIWAVFDTSSLASLYHHNMISEAGLHLRILWFSSCASLKLKCNGLKCRVQVSLGLPSEGTSCDVLAFAVVVFA